MTSYSKFIFNFKKDLIVIFLFLILKRFDPIEFKIKQR